MAERDKFTQVASQIPFDNETNSFVSEDTQSAIEEVREQVLTSASPGFSFGRSSNVNDGTWLSCESVPSNKSGRFVYIDNAVINRVFVSSETVSTYTLEVYYNEKSGSGLNLLGSVTVNSNYGGFFITNWPTPLGVELAIKLVGGSAKNVVAGLELIGTLV